MSERVEKKELIVRVAQRTGVDEQTAADLVEGTDDVHQ